MSWNGNKSIDERQNDFKLHEVTAVQIANLFSEARDSLKHFNDTPAPVLPATTCKKESKMENNQYHMECRVNEVQRNAVRAASKDFHIEPDRTPETVQGVQDAMSAGHYVPRKGVKPTDKVRYGAIHDYFEFRSTPADVKSFEAVEKKVEFEAQKTLDSIRANPDPVKAYADFTAFLTAWEPQPGVVAS